MKSKFKSVERTKFGVTIVVQPPAQVTDSKHAKLIQGMRTLIEKSEEAVYTWSPFTIADEFMRLLAANKSEGTRSYILSEGLSKFPQRNFLRHGDPNCLKDVSRAWFNEHGVELDVQVDILNGLYTKDYTLNDVIDHVMSYKPGDYAKPLQGELSSIVDDFRAKFGFKLTPAYAMALLNIKPLPNDDPPF